MCVCVCVLVEDSASTRIHCCHSMMPFETRCMLYVVDTMPCCRRPIVVTSCMLPTTIHINTIMIRENIPRRITVLVRRLQLKFKNLIIREEILIADIDFIRPLLKFSGVRFLLTLYFGFCS